MTPLRVVDPLMALCWKAVAWPRLIKCPDMFGFITGDEIMTNGSFCLIELQRFFGLGCAGGDHRASPNR